MYTFMQIQHYKIHEHLTPFVGNYYDEYKMLLIAESHYLPPHSQFKDIDTRNKWYVSEIKESQFICDQKICIKEYFEEIKEYTNTRFIVNKFINNLENPSTTFNKPHAIFLNPLTKLQEAKKEEEISFHHFSFMNYFQIPSQTSGGSINVTETDSLFAYNNLVEVCNILKPRTIIFLSSLSYKSFLKHERNLQQFQHLNHTIENFAHPCSPWWNRRTNDNSRSSEKFFDLMKKQIKLTK